VFGALENEVFGASKIKDFRKPAKSLILRFRKTEGFPSTPKILRIFEWMI